MQMQYFEKLCAFDLGILLAFVLSFKTWHFFSLLGRFVINTDVLAQKLQE